MRIHILRPDSITPIERYLEKRRSAADDYKVQTEFACVLLYREREYRSMYQSKWRPEKLPAPDPSGPFAPYDLTASAQAVLTNTIRSIWDLEELLPDAPNDLFGLKQETLEGLTGTIRPIKAHAFGHLLASKLAGDLCQHDEAIRLGERALSTGADPATALALVYHSALSAMVSKGVFDGDAVTHDVERRAREYLSPRRQWRGSWHVSAVERLDERIRKAALDARARVEGDAFSRFLTTEADFCESERLAALEGFDETLVPEDLRELIPLAQRFGVGDDACRGLIIRKTPRADRRPVVDAVHAHSTRIDQWLKSLGEPYGREASCYFWLLEAAEEM